jgi:hypothetical protein
MNKNKKVQLNKKDITAVIAIILLMVSGLVYGLSALKTNTVDGPKESMTEECKKLWLEQGEEVAVNNGC